MPFTRPEFLSTIGDGFYNIPVIFQPPKKPVVVDRTAAPSLATLTSVGLTDEQRTANYNASIRANNNGGGGGGGGGGGDSNGSGDAGGGGGNDEDGFSIFKIFEIVPIGINVLAKAPDLASGFADLAEGTAIGLINMALNSVDLFVSTFEFSIQGFKFAFILLLCLVENLSNLNACILFYLVDLILLVVYLALFSILKLLDVMFVVKMTGVSLVELVMGAAGPIVEFDDFVYSLTGYHLIHYPDYIIKMCYTCSIQLNTQETKDTGNTLTDVVTNIIPGRFDTPLNKITSAFSKFASIFDI